MGGIALMWRGGCIIRSRFLGKIKEAYDKNPQLTNLLVSGGRLVSTFATAHSLQDGERVYWPLHQRAEALVGEVEFDGAVGEEHERGRGN